MKICIFGAASAHIDELYVKPVEELGEMLAKRGHSLIFGGGVTGLMGAAARGFKRGGGYVLSVFPKFFSDEGVAPVNETSDKIIYADSMAERKRIMEDEADAFIVLPGGIGTFEEFFEVLVLKQLGRHRKAIVFFNIAGFYDLLENFMQSVTKRKFMNYRCYEMYSYAETAEEVTEFIESYKPSQLPWKDFKIGD